METAPPVATYLADSRRHSETTLQLWMGLHSRCQMPLQRMLFRRQSQKARTGYRQIS
uniref:Uncharacterized protein n=1 Tax=Setaria viridis TaxID=4556 RepID=A0A4U6U2T1_SETVI|nr:hypothetical protein SEVIR_6G128908v2 [Setaria viridis]